MFNKLRVNMVMWFGIGSMIEMRYWYDEILGL